MLTELLDEAEFGFSWIDISNPDMEELLEAGLMFQLPLKPVHDCIDFSHLPKYEEHGFTHFIILRSFFDKREESACTIEDMTRKVAIFWNDSYFITIHRIADDFMQSIKDGFLEEKNKLPSQNKDNDKQDNAISNKQAQLNIFIKILRKVIGTYEEPIDKFEELFDTYEDDVFKQINHRILLSNTYLLKRQLAVYRRMLRLTLDAIRKLELSFTSDVRPIEYLRADGERFLSIAEATLDNLHNLLALHVSFQNNHTNEIVRVLTIFSAFFMPLTFIAGVYGMNFEFMPELKTAWGYPFAILLMLVVSGFIFAWFKRKKWIGSNEEENSLYSDVELMAINAKQAIKKSEP